LSFSGTAAGALSSNPITVNAVAAVADFNNIIVPSGGTLIVTASSPDFLPITSAPIAIASPQSFQMAAIQSSQTLMNGQLGGVVLQLTSLTGGLQSVQLSCSGGPANTLCAGMPQTVSLNGTADAVLGVMFPSGTTPGDYPVTCTATSGSSSASVTVTFTVQ
jgi:hypothetical protein